MTAPLTTSCPTCRSVVASTDRFCKVCGAEVSGMSAAFAPDGARMATPPALAAGSPWELVLARLRDVTRDEFEVGRELGRGGMAAVFLAQDLALNRRVAIKVMAPGLMLGEGMVQRFRAEAITIANLSHAHIVTVHAVRQLQDLHFFVMQFVEGQSLEAVLRRHGPLPLEVVRVILHHVGSALAYAHRRGVVHRDVKPGNILFSADGDALVTDFGIAKVAEGPTQTQTGMVVGTPTYMSPEQCYATELDGASDQYSLGIVAYQMLTGTVPFTGAAFEIMRGHTSEPVPSLRALRPDVPESVDAAVLRMLAKRAGDRFASFGDALAALGAHAIGEDSPLRAQLIQLAAVEERRELLGDLLRTPGAAMSGTRSRPRSGEVARTNTPSPLTPPPGGAPPAGSTPSPFATPGTGTPGTGTPGIGTPSWGTPSGGTPSALPPLATPPPPGVTQFAGATSVVALRVSELPGALRVGDRLTLSAVPIDREGRPVDRPVRWSAVGSAVTVSEAGLLEAHEAGRGAISVACDGIYETLVVAVLAADAPTPIATPVAPTPTTPPAAASRAVAPPEPAAAAAGATASSDRAGAPRSRPAWLYAAGAIPVLLVAVLLLKGGEERPPTLESGAQAPTAASQGAPPGVSDAADNASPDPTAAPSSTDVAADAPPLDDNPTAAGSSPDAAPAALQVRLTPLASSELRVGESLRLRAAVTDGRTGREVSGTPVRFGSSDRGIARIDNTTGEITAVRPGRVTLTATAGESRAATTLVVVAAPVAQANPSGAAATTSVSPANPGPVTPPPDPQPATNSGAAANVPPANVPPPTAEPATPAPSAAQLETEARTIITQYARAYESRELDRVRTVWPGLTSGFAEQLTVFFDLARDVRVTINGLAAPEGWNGSSGSRTRVNARVTIRFNDGRRGQTQNDTWPITLERAATGWRIVNVGG